MRPLALEVAGPEEEVDDAFTYWSVVNGRIRSCPGGPGQSCCDGRRRVAQNPTFPAERQQLMGKHSMPPSRSWPRIPVMSAATAVGAIALALIGAGTAEGKTHHGAGAPGNPFGGSQQIGPTQMYHEAGFKPATTSYVSHSSGTTSNTGTENNTGSTATGNTGATTSSTGAEAGAATEASTSTGPGTATGTGPGEGGRTGGVGGTGETGATGGIGGIGGTGAGATGRTGGTGSSSHR
jgi:hypothetical protein